MIENWCATDPCDPDSERPDNITKTAKEYAGFDVSALSIEVLAAIRADKQALHREYVTERRSRPEPAHGAGLDGRRPE
jgi:hypothetical protein